MDKVIKPTAPLAGVGFGQTATLDIPPGPRFHALWLEVVVTAAAGVTLALSNWDKILGLINLKINGKVQRAHTAAELDAIQTSYGTDNAANAYNHDGGVLCYSGGLPQVPVAAKETVFYLPIFLAEPWRKSYAAQESMAWYTKWQDGSLLQSFQLEVTIPTLDAAVLLAGSTIAINCLAETDTATGPLDTTQSPVALITKWKRLTVPYAGSGDLYITNLPRRDVYLQISAFQATDSISSAKVKVDGRDVRDVTKGRNDQTLIGRGMNEAGIVEKRFDIVFDYSDLPTDGLVMQAGPNQVQDFQLILNMAAAAAANKTVTLISQTYGGID